MPKRSSTSEDPNVRAFEVVKQATEEGEEVPPRERQKDPAAVALGRRGGFKGGPARAAKLSARKKKAIAKKAAKARWDKEREKAKDE